MTVLEDMITATTNYQTACDAVFEDETVPPKFKAKMGEVINIIFGKMDLVNDHLTKFYNPPE